MNPPSAITFSVIVPFYNAGKYLERCLQSVRAQTHIGFEAIFIDDGSTDGGHTIIAAASDSRIQLLRQNNKGVSAARNLGINASRHEFIAFLDADDEWLGHHLKTLAELIHSCPDGGLYSTGYRLVEADGSWPTDIFVRPHGVEAIQARDPFPLWAECQVNNCSNTVVRKTLLKKVGLFVEGADENEDLDLWIRIAALQHPTIFSDKITCMVHRTPPEGKPRYKKRTDCIFACKTALRHLQTWPVDSRIKAKSLQHYVRAMISRFFWNAVSQKWSNRAQIILTNSGASEFGRIYLFLAKRAYCWPFLRIISSMRAIVLSRMFMRLLGGYRRAGDVVYRLTDSGEAWNAYVSRLWKQRLSK